MGINITTSTLLYKHAFMAMRLETKSGGLLLLVKHHLTWLVPGWVTQGSCSGWASPGLLQW